MDAERGVLHRYPVSQFARTRASCYFSRFTEDANAGSEESGQSEAGPDPGLESKSTAPAESGESAAHVGVRVALSDQYESV